MVEIASISQNCNERCRAIALSKPFSNTRIALSKLTGENIVEGHEDVLLSFGLADLVQDGEQGGGDFRRRNGRSHVALERGRLGSRDEASTRISL